MKKEKRKMKMKMKKEKIEKKKKTKKIKIKRKMRRNHVFKKMKRRVGVEEGIANEKRTTIMDLPDEILREEILRKIRRPVDLWSMTRATKHWNLLFKSMTNPFSGLDVSKLSGARALITYGSLFSIFCKTSYTDRIRLLYVSMQSI
ncbi:unnamed protein product [Arabidopsis lyrata]|uniref:Predicted protein n=1 Tax=Arabidopsis lyrata subsp. lyrata TaxID=81972 RepID=D7MC76_ARALL|nr:predicted protein [Arabidopsis lyrata subsp. lyrata]CAH8274841.1 unnamed protein product [Arabidopsis lyrata]